jgi:hypothetical protein
MALSFSLKRKTQPPSEAAEVPNEAEQATPLGAEKVLHGGAEESKRGFLSKLQPKATKKQASAKLQSKQRKAPKLPAVRKRSCFVLMAGDDGGILTYLEKGAVARRVFAPSTEEQHLKSMMQLLNAHPNVPIYLLSDMIDQSYVRHSLPPVSAFSISKLVKRRLERDFAPEDIKGSLPLGREKEGRKEWNFMLVSLANSTTLQQWLQPVLEAPNQFKGIYLMPVEAQAFIGHLCAAFGDGDGEKSNEWKVLVSHDKVGGFRQVVLQGGNLVFTRLTQLPSDIAPDVLAGNVEQEVQNTIEYLRRMSFEDDAGLDVFIIVAQEVRDLIEVTKLGATRIKTMSPYDASKLLKLDQAALSGDRFSDVVISANFGLRQKPVLKMLTAYAKKLDRLYQVKFGVTVLGALVVLAALGMGIKAMASYWSGYESQDDINAQLNIARLSLANTEKQHGMLDENQEVVVRVSALYAETASMQDTPLDFISKLARLKESKFTIANWSWKLDEEESEPQQHIITIKAEILGHNADRRELSKQVKNLMADLRASLPLYEVSRSELPEEVEKEEAQGVVLDLNAPDAVESFELQPGDEMVTFVFKGPSSKPAGEAS